MLKYFAFLLACFAFASDVSAQMLIVDRAPGSGASQSLGLSKESNAFLADDFVAGAAKEDWVIDHIRVWAVADPRAGSSQNLGDLFKKISLYGGIAPEMPVAGQAAECDCHNLPALKTATLQQGSNSTDAGDVTITSSKQEGSGIWQIDFKDMKWSVPGGTPIQFGILADPYAGATWYNLGSSTDSQHLRVFSNAGKVQSTYQGDSSTSGAMNIQVWGHLLARITIHTAGQKYHVILRNQSYLDGSQVDPASLHFGPGKAAAENVHVEDVGHNGKADLVMYFRATDSGLPAKSVNACLTGKRLDGAPFEGCDLLGH